MATGVAHEVRAWVHTFGAAPRPTDRTPTGPRSMLDLATVQALSVVEPCVDHG
jgi:hypothetical protein